MYFRDAQLSRVRPENRSDPWRLHEPGYTRKISSVVRVFGPLRSWFLCLKGFLWWDSKRRTQPFEVFHDIPNSELLEPYAFRVEIRSEFLRRRGTQSIVKVKIMTFMKGHLVGEDYLGITDRKLVRNLYMGLLPRPQSWRLWPVERKWWMGWYESKP